MLSHRTLKGAAIAPGRPCNDIWDEDLSTCGPLLEKGVELLGGHKFKAAQKYFEAALVANPRYHPSANNLSLCHFYLGEVDEAIRVLRKSFSDSPYPNVFGLASLSICLYILDDLCGSTDAIHAAAAMTMLSEDSVVKVCEALACHKRHHDILSVARRSAFADTPRVCFYTGVAAANLGDFTRAETDLGHASCGGSLDDIIRMHLQTLRDGATPNTVRGDWTYTSLLNLCPRALLSRMLKPKNMKAWAVRQISVDAGELALNEAVAVNASPQDSLMMLCASKHPAATELLRTLATSSFGSDQLRMAAAMELHDRAALKQGEKLDVLYQGKRSEKALHTTKLDPDFQFCPALPPRLQKIYIKAVKAVRAKRPNWERLDALSQEIMSEAPDYFPMRYNYAVSLIRRDRDAEAEPILRDLVARHSAYLFAHAALLQLLCRQDRMDEADALVQACPMLDETHVSSYVAWLMALSVYYMQKDEEDIALQCVESASAINPDMLSIATPRSKSRKK